MSYMLVSNEEAICDEWKKYKGYTVRPLPSVISYYSKMIKKYAKNSNCLMYGGTPEIRSIFQQYKMKINMIDKSETIVRSMGRLTEMSIPISPNENFILSDWLDTRKLKSEKYDFVIGDDAINMVDWNNFNTFLKCACDLMEENAYFVCHLLLKPDDEHIDKTFSDICDEYNKGSIRSVYDLASRLNFICYDRKSYGMGWQQTIERVGIKNLNKLKPDFDFCDIFGRCNSRFYCPPEDEFEALVSQYFTIKEIFYPHEHDYCLFEPVYLLQKKNVGCSYV